MHLQDIDIFWFITRKKRTGFMEKFVSTVQGHPTPPRKADLEQAVNIAADEILMGMVRRQEVRQKAEVLHLAPVHYSTHDLALSAAVDFFVQPEYTQRLKVFHVFALIQAIQWVRQGLVAPVWVEKFAEVLGKLDESRP